LRKDKKFIVELEKFKELEDKIKGIVSEKGF